MRLTAGTRRRVLPAAVALLVLAVAGGFSAIESTGALGTDSQAGPQDWIFVTEDTSHDRGPDTVGCDAISAFDVRSGEAQFRGLTSVSPGRLAAAEDFSVVVAGPAQTWGPDMGHLYVVRPSLDGPWESMEWVGGTSLAPLGAVAMLPDGDTVLVSTARWARVISPPVSPFGLEAYRLTEIREGGFIPFPYEYPTWRLGPRHGRLETPGMPAQILKAPDSDYLHAITESADWTVLTIDPERMAEVAPRFRLQRLARSLGAFTYTGWIFGSLSTDGRYLVTGRGLEDTSVNVADLHERRSWTVDIGQESNGTALNRGWINTGLLAISHPEFVGIYRWDAPDQFTQVGRVPARPGWQTTAPLGTVAWSASGRELIVAEFVPRSDGDHEFSVHAISDGGEWAGLLHRLVACNSINANLPIDILTANGSLGPSPTPTEPPPTPTATGPPATASPTPIPSGVTPSVVPRRAYLPIAVARQCVAAVRADIVLVLDTSSSMREFVAPGERKLDAAIAAASQFLERLSPDDQAAIVAFNASAVVAAGLTSDVAVLVGALHRLETAEFTRIDLGIQAARDELSGVRRRQANRPVMIVLTDGRSNPVPVEVAEAEASAAKAAGITLFTIGFGERSDLDHEALGRMASRPDYYYDAPDAADLAGIYREIGDAIPCPAR